MRMLHLILPRRILSRRRLVNTIRNLTPWPQAVVSDGSRAELSRQPGHCRSNGAGCGTALCTAAAPALSVLARRSRTYSPEKSGFMVCTMRLMRSAIKPVRLSGVLGRLKRKEYGSKEG